MGKFSMWLQRITYGRYGTDNLNKFLLTVSLICIVANVFIHSYALRLLTVLLLILVYCRMFSRNFPARARENERYLAMTNRFKRSNHSGSYSSGTGYGYGYGANTGYSGPRPKATKQKADPNYKILRCPACSGKLRVPKGVGKINITCPHCNLKFVKKV
ncbi:MAG: hypothetical protein KBS66_05785 [Eubacterium sp.]|nr:hypothetical protein [Candidatus Colimonas fimequi]